MIGKRSTMSRDAPFLGHNVYQSVDGVHVAREGNDGGVRLGKQLREGNNDIQEKA